MFTVSDGIVKLFFTCFTKDHIAVFTLDFSDLSASITLFLFFVNVIKDDFMKDLIFSA